MMKIPLMVVLFIALCPFHAKAEEQAEKWTALQVSIWEPYQLFGKDRDVYGLRVNALYGKNRNVYGLDIGTLNESGDTTGIQMGLLVNAAKGSFTGIQAAGGFNYMGGEGLWGIQASLLGNYADGDLNGLQVGMVNVAERVRGVQIGLVNYCQKMSGLQIGLVNIVKEGWLPYSTVLNVSLSR